MVPPSDHSAVTVPMTDIATLPRIVPLEGCTNFRDLGGYRTAGGRRGRAGVGLR